MPTTLRDFLAHTETLWPSAGQEDWDNSGLVSGRLDSTVSRVLLAVDVTDETVTEALDGGFDILVAHHPLLLRALTTMAEDRYKGDLLARLIRGGCALLGVHTNGDRVESGTSATLATALGIDSTGVIVPNALGGGLGIHGTVAPTTLEQFARHIASVLPSTAGGVRVSGDPKRQVTSVSVCAGAGDSLLGNSVVRGTDVYVTSDLRHHPASEFREQARLDSDTALIDISHWAAEWMWLSVGAQELSAAAPGLAVTVSEINTDPWTFTVVQ